jgi:hypothetical protein
MLYIPTKLKKDKMTSYITVHIDNPGIIMKTSATVFFIIATVALVSSAVITGI